MPQRKQELPYLINCCKSRPLNFACIQGFNLDHFVLLSLVGHFTVPRDIHLEQEVKSVMLGTMCGPSAFSQIEARFLGSWHPWQNPTLPQDVKTKSWSPWQLLQDADSLFCWVLKYVLSLTPGIMSNSYFSLSLGLDKLPDHNWNLWSCG